MNEWNSGGDVFEDKSGLHSVLVLAPHLKFPARNGSDISLERIARHLSSGFPYVDLLAEDTCVRYQRGREIGREHFRNSHRPRSLAAIRTLALRSHFFVERFITRRYASIARRYLADPGYGVVLCSYIATTKLVSSTQEHPGRKYLIWTHNDEFKWFHDLQRSSNPLVSLPSRASEKWLHNFFRREEDSYVFLHVTESDRDGFARYYPDHVSAIIPIGVDVQKTAAVPLPAKTDRVRLMFVGSLNVRMNLDALLHLADQYDAYLKQRLGDALEILIVGSNPSRAIEDLCRSRDWRLHANVSDEELDRLYESATFSILPFGYATGAKLKLLGSLAHGVPFLATSKVSPQRDACVYPSLIADEPAEWLDRIEEVRRKGISRDDRERLFSIARHNSWDASARLIRNILQRPAGDSGA